MNKFKEFIKLGFYPLIKRNDGMVMVRDNYYFLFDCNSEREGKLHIRPRFLKIFTGKKSGTGYELANSGLNRLKW